MDIRVSKRHNKGTSLFLPFMGKVFFLPPDDFCFFSVPWRLQLMIVFHPSFTGQAVYHSFPKVLIFLLVSSCLDGVVTQPSG